MRCLKFTTGCPDPTTVVPGECVKCIPDRCSSTSSFNSDFGEGSRAPVDGGPAAVGAIETTSSVESNAVRRQWEFPTITRLGEDSAPTVTLTYSSTSVMGHITVYGPHIPEVYVSPATVQIPTSSSSTVAPSSSTQINSSKSTLSSPSTTITSNPTVDYGTAVTAGESSSTTASGDGNENGSMGDSHSNAAAIGGGIVSRTQAKTNLSGRWSGGPHHQWPSSLVLSAQEAGTKVCTRDKRGTNRQCHPR